MALDYYPVTDLLSSFQILAALQAQGTTILVMVLLFLFFLSFVLSGAEVAFFSLTHKDINLLRSKQIPPYQRIVDLLEEPKSFLASLLIANSFVFKEPVFNYSGDFPFLWDEIKLVYDLKT